MVTSIPSDRAIIEEAGLVTYAEYELLVTMRTRWAAALDALEAAQAECERLRSRLAQLTAERDEEWRKGYDQAVDEFLGWLIQQGQQEAFKAAKGIWRTPTAGEQP